MKIRLVLIVLALAGCAASPEIRYYTLSVEEHSYTSAPEGRGAGDTQTAFSIATVRLPGLLDRPQILLRTGRQTVELLDNDRWAEPLDQAVPRILSQDLALRQPHGGKAMRLHLAIDSFIADQSGEVELSGHWWSVAPDAESNPPERHAFRVSAPLKDGSAPQIAAAMSAALARLADQLAEGR